MSRTPIMAGNWKMNLNHIDAVGLVQKLAWTLADERYDTAQCEAVVIPPFTGIRSVQTLIDGDKLPLKHGAQDLSPHDDGAYTGDISADMLVKLDCSYVVVGHSERREYHAETDEIVNAKVKAAFGVGLLPIMCVGETLEENESGRTAEVVTRQVKEGLAGLSPELARALVIAYEPVWAIGTGRASTADAANQVIAETIRKPLAELFGADVAEAVRVLYGGSVTGANAAEFFGMPEIDGALVGGASLKPADFQKIVEAAAK